MQISVNKKFYKLLSVILIPFVAHPQTALDEMHVFNGHETKVYRGVISNKMTGIGIPYVNIGIQGRDVGTVSDSTGRYKLLLDPKYDNDTLKISSIGYKPLSIQVGLFKKIGKSDFKMEEKVNELASVIVRPRTYGEKTLGVTSKSKFMPIGFQDNMLGYECGILMKVKKSAIIKKVHLNFAESTYDSLFYRINVYKALSDSSFENILQEPVYLNLVKEDIKHTVTINMEKYHLQVDRSFLVTVELIKDLGQGHVYFSGGLSHKTYYRKTSQGKWLTSPLGVSVSVDAKVEK